MKWLWCWFSVISLFLSSFQSINLSSCLCYVISAVCVLWVLISLCSFGLISVCPFGCWFCVFGMISYLCSFYVFIAVLFGLWFLSFLLLLQTWNYSMALICSTDDSSHQVWPERLRVHFMFTRANWVRGGSTQNSIWLDLWTALLADTHKHNEIHYQFLLFLFLNDWLYHWSLHRHHAGDLWEKNTIVILL